ncbi:MAG: histidinol-phosphate transaminase [Pseudomonadota bacterium]|jgi:histidinol-phosphate aminotransferase
MSIFKSHITAMSAYKPPLDGRDAHEHLLLDFNERTLPVSQAVEDALVDYIRSGRLQMYPAYGDVVSQIARYAQVSDEQVMITNGSDQGIELIIRASCREGDEAIIPGPGFAFYAQCAKVEHLTIIEPKYRFNEGFPFNEVLAAITERTRVICLANPNNPCGTPISREQVFAIAKAAPHAAILVDECYYEYVKTTVVDAVEQYPNLVITRTFSKTWGIPSLRLGYIISHPRNILALLNVRGPYDVNQLAVVAIKAALKDPAATLGYVDEVMQQSKPALEAYLQAKNIKFWPSATNYLWTFPANPKEIAEGLQKEGILVRPRLDADGVLGLRITIGTLAQTQRLMGVLERWV